MYIFYSMIHHPFSMNQIAVYNVCIRRHGREYRYAASCHDWPYFDCTSTKFRQKIKTQKKIYTTIFHCRVLYRKLIMRIEILKLRCIFQKENIPLQLVLQHFCYYADYCTYFSLQTNVGYFIIVMSHRVIQKDICGARMASFMTKYNPLMLAHSQPCLHLFISLFVIKIKCFIQNE